MTTKTDTPTKTEEETSTGDVWPPLAHLIEPWQIPVKEGTIALCGKKLMGIDLEGMHCPKLCQACYEIARRAGA